MERRRRPSKAATHGHSVACADMIMARRAENVVALLPAGENVGTDFEREGCCELSVDTAGIEMVVFIEMAARDNADGERSRRSVIREERTFFEWFVTRLIGHLLATGGK